MLDPSSLSLSADDLSIYSQLFHIGDVEKRGVISAATAVPLLTRSKLPQTTLAEIWQLGDPEGKGYLTQQGFYRVLKLVAVAQMGQPVMLNLLSMTRRDTASSPPPPDPIFSSPAPTSYTSPYAGASPAAGAMAPPPPPQISSEDKARWQAAFVGCSPTAGMVGIEQAGAVFVQSGLPPDTLRTVRNLVDPTASNRLSLPSFSAAMYILSRLRSHELTSVPTSLPSGLLAQFEHYTTPSAASPASAQPATPPAYTQPSPLPSQQQSLGSVVLGQSRPPFQASSAPPAAPGLSSISSGTSFASPGATVGLGFGKMDSFSTATLGGQGGPPAAPAARPAASSVLGTLGGLAQNDGWIVPQADRGRYGEIFDQTDGGRKGYLTGEEAVNFFVKSNLPQEQLAQIWDLAAIRKIGQLSRDEFSVAMHLIRQARQGIPLPTVLPADLVPPSLKPAAPVPAPAPVPPQQTQSVKDLFDFGSPALTPVPAVAKPPAMALVDVKGAGSGFGNLQATSALSLSNLSPLSAPSAGPPASSMTTTASPSLLSSSPPSSFAATQNAGLESIQKDLGRARVDIRLGESQLADSQRQVAELTHARSTLEMELRQLGEQKREVSIRIATARSEVEARRRANVELEAAVRREQAELAAAQDEVSRSNKEAEEMRNAGEAVEALLAKTRADGEKVRAEIAAAGDRAAVLRVQLEKLRAEERQLRTYLEQARQMQATAVQHAEQLAKEKVDMEKSNEALKASIAATAAAAVPKPSPPATTLGTPGPIARHPPPPPPSSAAKNNDFLGLDIASSAAGLGLAAPKKDSVGATASDKGKEKEPLRDLPGKPVQASPSTSSGTLLSPPSSMGEALRGNTPSPLTEFQAKFPEMPMTSDAEDPFAANEFDAPKPVLADSFAVAAKSPPLPAAFEADFSSAFGREAAAPAVSASPGATTTTSSLTQSRESPVAPNSSAAKDSENVPVATIPSSPVKEQLPSNVASPDSAPNESFPSMEDFEAEFEKSPTHHPSSAPPPMSPVAASSPGTGPPPVPPLSLKPISPGTRPGHSPQPSGSSEFDSAFGMPSNTTASVNRAKTPDLETEFKAAFGPGSGAPPSELASVPKLNAGKDLAAFDFEAEFSDDAFKFTPDFGGAVKPGPPPARPAPPKPPAMTAAQSAAFEADFGSAFSEPFPSIASPGIGQAPGSDPFAAAFGPSQPVSSNSGGARASWDLDTVFGPGPAFGGMTTGVNGKDPFGASPTFGPTNSTPPPAYSGAADNAFIADFSSAFGPAAPGIAGATAFPTEFAQAPTFSLPSTFSPGPSRQQDNQSPDGKDIPAEVKQVMELTGVGAERAMEALVKYDMNVESAHTAAKDSPPLKPELSDSSAHVSTEVSTGLENSDFLSVGGVTFARCSELHCQELLPVGDWNNHLSMHTAEKLHAEEVAGRGAMEAASFRSLKRRFEGVAADDEFRSAPSPAPFLATASTTGGASVPLPSSGYVHQFRTALQRDLQSGRITSSEYDREIERLEHNARSAENTLRLALNESAEASDNPDDDALSDEESSSPAQPSYDPSFPEKTLGLVPHISMLLSTVGMTKRRVSARLCNPGVVHHSWDPGGE
ncbi:hypothetical protein HDU93_004686 [Gonapodya sp. JEL0774]|nr:hypothetical protein HDU93_004686 [Gonapodya sp. JEL0774]